MPKEKRWTKTDLKEWAQDEIMRFASSGPWSRLNELFEKGTHDEIEHEARLEALDKQLSRVEKLFGYAKSWKRGGSDNL